MEKTEWRISKASANAYMDELATLVRPLDANECLTARCRCCSIGRFCAEPKKSIENW